MKTKKKSPKYNSFIWQSLHMVVGYHSQVISPLAKDYPLFKIGNKTEKKSRPFGYNVNYTEFQ